MTTQRALKQLMLELLYPAVLGAVIYSMLDVARPFLERYVLRSPLGPPESGMGLQVVLWLVTAAFYCIDYLYVMFSKNYGWKFFFYDLAFLVGLYVTVTAIGLTGTPQHPPYLRSILVTYCVFLVLYFAWDLSEKYKCTDENERRWYGTILAWEGISFSVLLVLIFAISWIRDQKCAGYVVAGVLGVITVVFAILTWQKKLFYDVADVVADRAKDSREDLRAEKTAEEVTRAEYLKDFAGPGHLGDRMREALERAHEIRKFEIDLYWKRAAYFWTFIAATFAGYFAFQKDTDKDIESTCLIACLGFLFSVAWYFVNRGSKAWQRNWELHVDLLEDEVMGPLYKSVLNPPASRFWNLTDAFPFSPSRINQLVGLFVILVWLFLMGRTLFFATRLHCSELLVCGAMAVITLGASVVVFVKGRTREGGKNLRFYRQKREYR